MCVIKNQSLMSTSNSAPADRHSALYLQSNGARALAAGLEGNATLEALSLAWNALGDAGVAALAGMLLQVGRPIAVCSQHLRGTKMRSDGCA